MSKQRTPVVIESPFAGKTPELLERNRRYLKIAMLHSLSRGEAPFASHALYTQFLDDTDERERGIGISAGFVWQGLAERVCVYTDLGISPGMAKGIENASKIGLEIKMRTVEDWETLSKVWVSNVCVAI